MSKIKHKTNKAKRVSHQCRNNNQCPYCRGNRLYNSTRKKLETSLWMKSE